MEWNGIKDKIISKEIQQLNRIVINSEKINTWGSRIKTRWYMWNQLSNKLREYSTQYSIAVYKEVNNSIHVECGDYCTHTQTHTFNHIHVPIKINSPFITVQMGNSISLPFQFYWMNTQCSVVFVLIELSLESRIWTILMTKYHTAFACSGLYCFREKKERKKEKKLQLFVGFRVLLKL